MVCKWQKTGSGDKCTHLLDPPVVHGEPPGIELVYILLIQKRENRE